MVWGEKETLKWNTHTQTHISTHRVAGWCGMATADSSKKNGEEKSMKGSSEAIFHTNASIFKTNFPQMEKLQPRYCFLPAAFHSVIFSFPFLFPFPFLFFFCFLAKVMKNRLSLLFTRVRLRSTCGLKRGIQ